MVSTNNIAVLHDSEKGLKNYLVCIQAYVEFDVLGALCNITIVLNNYSIVSNMISLQVMKALETNSYGSRARLVF